MYLLKSESKNYSSHELAEKLAELIKSERKITNEILKLINEALEKRSYLDLGYPSMFEWLTKGFGYSNAAAYRRIEAARLLRSLPETSKSEVVRKIGSGEVNLTTLSKIQLTIKAQEKVSGDQGDGSEESGKSGGDLFPFERKIEEETQRILFQLLPDAKKDVTQDRKTMISEDLTRHSMESES